MGDPRVESITKIMKEIRDKCTRFVELTEPEIMSYEMIHSDLLRKKQEVKEAEDKRMVAQLEIDEAKKMSKSINDVANEKATAIIEAGKTVMLQKKLKCEKLLTAVEQFVLEEDRKRYDKLVKETAQIGN